MTLEFIEHFECDNFGDFTLLIAESAQLALYSIIGFIQNILGFMFHLLSSIV